MKYAEFASVYPYAMTDAEIHRGAHAQYIADAQDWSYKWGRAAHAMLDTAELDVFRGGELKDYMDWHADGMSHMYDRLDTAPIEVRARGYNELNFHHLIGG
jgi:hypothetical protein